MAIAPPDRQAFEAPNKGEEHTGEELPEGGAGSLKDFSRLGDVDGLKKGLADGLEPASRQTPTGPQTLRRERRQINQEDFISYIGVGSFGSFLFYLTYYHISKYLQTRRRRRRSTWLDDLLPLPDGDALALPDGDALAGVSRVLQCLEAEEFVPTPRCFFG